MQRTRHIYNKIIAAMAVFIVVVCCIMFVAVESANAGNKIQDSSSFGLGEQKHNVETQVGVIANSEFEDPSSYESTSTNLSSYTTRDITTAITFISYQLESAAQAAAEAARISELLKSNHAKNNRNDFLRRNSMPPGLSDVNWDVSQAEFINEWSTRINNYFLGTPLANTGEIFAKAAWENGIDPRWSPAISNTESSKGFCCFASHNAWGWGDCYWNSWEDAINDHVSSLATSYGYTITPYYAQIYCPPNCDHWYSATLNQMQAI